MRETGPTTYFVVPCGAGKAESAAPARDLYVGSAFRHALAAAEAEAAATERDMGVRAEVLILSALHGLVSPDEVIAPYELKMGAAGSVDEYDVAAQIINRGIGHSDSIYAMLPKAYRAVLAAAGAWVGIAVQDVYEAAPGIGYQRGVGSSLVRSAATPIGE